MKNRIKILGVIIILIILFISLGLINNIAIRTYEINTTKISNDFTIAHISDLHSQMYGENQKQLIDKVIESKPDIIVLTGDIIDDKVDINGAKLFLEGIKNIAPIYYVTGNHEFWAINTNEILSIIESYGIHILDDEIKKINVKEQDIVISGINDPDVENKLYSDEFLSELSNSEFNILLAHRPERIDEYIKYNVDLVLAGHAHGGQFAIPYILNGLFSPNQGFFPKYAGGQYYIEDKAMIVSRGLSFNKYIPRFYNKPEIVIIYIRRTIND